MRKRIFNYDQRKLINSGLEIDELMILDYISYFKNTGKMDEYIKNGKSWNWISWAKIVNDLPFLGIKKEAAQRKCLYYLGTKPDDWNERFDNMKESSKKKAKNYKFLGFLEFNTVGKKGEEKTVFRFTQKWYDLINEEDEDSQDDDNKKDLSAATDKPLKVINKNSFDTDSITQNNENIQEENNPNLKLIKDFGIEVPEHTSEQLKNKVSKWDTDLLVLCMEYMNSKKNTISKYSIQYLVSIYNKPDFLNYKGGQPKAAEVSKNEYKSNLNPKIHNFEGSTDFLKYSDEELEDIILKGQKNKFREI